MSKCVREASPFSNVVKASPPYIRGTRSVSLCFPSAVKQAFSFSNRPRPRHRTRFLQDRKAKRGRFAYHGCKAGTPYIEEEDDLPPQLRHSNFDIRTFLHFFFLIRISKA
jgi:hypothetical protein